MLKANSSPKFFCAEAINTTYYLQKRIYIRPLTNKTPYEMYKDRKPNISYFHPFGVQSFILNTKDDPRKFDSKNYERILLEYFKTSKTYKVYNSGTSIIEEVIHVRFNDHKFDKSKICVSF